jgi:hypothetical protein
MESVEYIKRYKKNLRYIKKNHPKLYEELMREHQDEEFDIEVKFTTEKPQIFLNGKLAMRDFDVRIDSAYTEISDQLKKRFMELSVTLESEYWDNSLYFQSMRELQKIYSEYKSDTWVENRYLPFLIVYGVGFGYHLERILEDFNVYNLILVERDINLIRTSLYTLDWEKVLSNRNVDIVIGNETDKLLDEIVKKISSLNRFYIDYIMDFVLYPHAMFYEVIDRRKKEKSIRFESWGFFDDEYLSLLHTLKNIRKKPAFYIGKSQDLKDSTAFVIGSGPSLDEHLEFIKEVSDRVTILSAGTALRPLLKAGIWPDFQFIFERTKPPYTALVETLDEEKLKNLKIVAVNLAYPAIFDSSENRFMVLRGTDTGTFLFPSEYNLFLNTAPTVTNMALSFALEAGFEKVYLFGVDLGAQKDRHHSKESIYYKSDKFAASQEFPFAAEGNFGGEVYTNHLFLSAKRSFEVLLRHYPNRMVYNCSYGVKIEGAYPAKIDLVEIESSNKISTIGKIVNSFDENFFTEEQISSIERKAETTLRDFRVYIRYFLWLLKSASSLDAFYHRINRLHERIFKDFQNVSSRILFMSAVNHQLSYILTALYGMDEEKGMRFFARSIDVLEEYLRQCERKLSQLLKS